MSDVCRIATLCQTDTITSRPSQADNEALSTSLSSQLTAAGTNGIVLTPPPRPSARDCFSFDSPTKADQSAKHSHLGTKTTHLTMIGDVRQEVTAVTVRLEPNVACKN